MVNYIIEIGRAEAYKSYGGCGRTEIFGKIKKIENDKNTGLPTVYVCVKRNVNEPVYILTETETKYGFEGKPEFAYKKCNANGKCIGECTDFEINKESIVCNGVNWLSTPVNKRKVLELCKSKKEKC